MSPPAVPPQVFQDTLVKASSAPLWKSWENITLITYQSKKGNLLFTPEMIVAQTVLLYKWKFEDKGGEEWKSMKSGFNLSKEFSTSALLENTKVSSKCNLSKVVRLLFTRPRPFYKSVLLEDGWNHLWFIFCKLLLQIMLSLLHRDGIPSLSLTSLGVFLSAFVCFSCFRSLESSQKNDSPMFSARSGIFAGKMNPRSTNWTIMQIFKVELDN